VGLTADEGCDEGGGPRIRRMPARDHDGTIVPISCLAVFHTSL
jgi:hypothetical protein